MHDLVVLDNTTVGVIVNVEQDALRVLTNQACGGWGRGGCVWCGAWVGVGVGVGAGVGGE